MHLSAMTQKVHVRHWSRNAFNTRVFGYCLRHGDESVKHSNSTLDIPVFLLDISLAVSRWWICKTQKLHVRHWRRSACVFGSGCVKQKHHVRHWSLNAPIFWIFHWLRHDDGSVRHRKSTLDILVFIGWVTALNLSDTEGPRWTLNVFNTRVYIYIYGCVTAMNLWNTETLC